MQAVVMAAQAALVRMLVHLVVTGVIKTIVTLGVTAGLAPEVDYNFKVAAEQDTQIIIAMVQ
jgi:hypothetical protein